MIDELDLLKKHWQKQEAGFKQVDEKHIYQMIQKRSSSSIRWILIISIIELSLGFILSFALSFSKFDQKNMDLLKEMGAYPYYIGTSVVIYAVVAFFIWCFYKMYRKIHNDDSVKELIHTILNTRKVVKNYILFNLTAFAIIFISAAYYGLYWGVQNKTIDGNPSEVGIVFYLISMAIIIGITAVLTLLFWLFYKLIYGWLVKRLTKNYEELKKIEN